jgi:hypothetical protein
MAFIASTLGRRDFTRLSLDEPNIFLANPPTLTMNGPFNPDDAGLGPAGSAARLQSGESKAPGKRFWTQG